MRHRYDDATVGAYLAGELPDGSREAFEAHLLTCDRCWAEVDVGRRGRTLAQLTREPVPPRLAVRVAGAVAAERHGAPGSHLPTDGARSRRGGLRHGRRAARSWPLAAAALVLVAVLGTVVVVARGSRTEPAPQIAVAVAGYHDDRLPGTTIPVRPGPDLSALRLSGAGTGDLAGQPVTGYAYRDDTGRRLLVYISDRPFPVPNEIENPVGTDGAGLMRLHGVVVLCSRSPHTTLVLAADEDLVRQAAAVLDLT